VLRGAPDASSCLVRRYVVKHKDIFCAPLQTEVYFFENWQLVARYGSALYSMVARLAPLRELTEVLMYCFLCVSLSQSLVLCVCVRGQTVIFL
jgi:hypothetical protein